VDDIFIVNEDQRVILETVGRLVEEVVTPRAAALDADPLPSTVQVGATGVAVVIDKVLP